MAIGEANRLNVAEAVAIVMAEQEVQRAADHELLRSTGTEQEETAAATDTEPQDTVPAQSADDTKGILLTLFFFS